MTCVKDEVSSLRLRASFERVDLNREFRLFDFGADENLPFYDAGWKMMMSALDGIEDCNCDTCMAERVLREVAGE